MELPVLTSDKFTLAHITALYQDLPYVGKYCDDLVNIPPKLNEE